MTRLAISLRDYEKISFPQREVVGPHRFLAPLEPKYG